MMTQDGMEMTGGDEEEGMVSSRGGAVDGAGGDDAPPETSTVIGAASVGEGAGGAPLVRSSSAFCMEGEGRQISISRGDRSHVRPPTLEGWNTVPSEDPISTPSLKESNQPVTPSTEERRQEKEVGRGGGGVSPPLAWPSFSKRRQGATGEGHEGEQHKPRRPRAVKAFRHRLNMAGRIAFSALLSTGINVFYAWSENLTWFGIVLSISGVGRNLGHTLQTTKDSWTGAVVAVPLCLILGQGIFSRVLTGVLVAITSFLVVACSGLPEAAKKLALIFIIWDVLIPAVAPAVTIVHLLVNLLKALLGSTIICLITILVPVPQLAVWDMCEKLRELTTLVQLLLETYLTIFCMSDHEVVDLEELLTQASTVLSECRTLLPDVRMELLLFRSSGAYHMVTKYLDTLEGQMETIAGMALSLADIPPNDTHIEFVRQMASPLARLLDELQKTTTAATELICEGLLGRPSKAASMNGSLFRGPKEALQACLRGLLRARMRVVYGRELRRDEASGSTVFTRSESADEAASAFMTESKRLGYMNLLPRNTFVLDLALFVEAIQKYEEILAMPGKAEPVLHTQKGDKSSQMWRLPRLQTVVAWLKRTLGWLLPSGKWLQPFKVSLAVGLSSIEVLVNNPTIGLQTIWGPLTVAQTMSSHSASSFKSGVNRVLGTVMGATYGMALIEWLGVRSKPLIAVLLTLWVFLCGLHRTSSTYGEAAVSAALTAPIVVVGPVLGSSGLVVRNMQVILGTVVYVVVDNVCWPERAKIKVREELVASVREFQALWLDELTVFATQVDQSALERGKQEAERLRRSLKREEAFIKLACEEPQLHHKAFPVRIYTRVLSAQWSIFRLLMMLYRSSMTFPMELAEHDHAMLTSLQSVLTRLKDTTLKVFSEALTRLEALQALSTEGVPPLLSLSGLRQEFHRIETDTDAFIDHFFAQDPVLTAIDFIVPLNGMIYSTRKLSGELCRFSQAVKELVDRETGQSWA